jgi:uncharacterized protein (UPF0548 family)
MSRFSYPEVGATRDDSLPAGYRHLRERLPIGHGAKVFEAASEAVLSWAMHRALPVGIESGGRSAEPGVTAVVRLGLGPLSVLAPCEVVWAVHGQRLAGFAYGTLRGHPEIGEEAFLVELDDSDDVWLTVIAFSRPGAWFTRLAGPLVGPMQRVYARRCAAVLRRLAAG